MAQFVEQTVRSLRNGLTFSDNFACDVLTVSLTHATPQIVQTSKTPVRACWPTRVTSSAYLVTGFSWYYDQSGNFTVCARFALHANPSTFGVLAAATADGLAHTALNYVAPLATALPVDLVVLF